MKTTFENSKSMALQSLTYGTPVAIGGISIPVLLQTQLGIILSILLPITCLLIYGLVLALLEIRKSRQEIQDLSFYIKERHYIRDRSRNRIRYSLKDPIESEDWYFLMNYSEEAKRYEELILLLANKEGINLSLAAIDLLLIPILEQFQTKGHLDYYQVEASLRTIIIDIKETPSNFDTNKMGKRTTLSIIKAFWKNFCNIPPFCTEKDK